MVRFMYCKTGNALGEIGEILFPALEDAMEYIKAHEAGVLKDSAGYSVYSIVPAGDLPKTLYNFTRCKNE